MRDIFGVGVLGADVGYVGIGGDTSFLESIVTRVEVFPFLFIKDDFLWLESIPSSFR